MSQSNNKSNNKSVNKISKPIAKSDLNKPNLNKSINKTNNKPTNKPINKPIINSNKQPTPLNIINDTEIDPLDELIQYNTLDDKKDIPQNNILPNNIQQNNIEEPRNKFKHEITKDVTNNKLMERLNSELDLRIYGRNKHAIDKPYFEVNSNNVYDNNNSIATVDQIVSHGIPNDDFTSKRLGLPSNPSRRSFFE